jgi:hypothetical protein
METPSTNGVADLAQPPPPPATYVDDSDHDDGNCSRARLGFGRMVSEDNMRAYLTANGLPGCVDLWYDYAEPHLNARGFTLNCGLVDHKTAITFNTFSRTWTPCQSPVSSKQMAEYVKVLSEFGFDVAEIARPPSFMAMTFDI